MSDDSFELLGHDNPWGEYPAPVVPIGSLNNVLVAVYEGKEGAEIVELEEKVKFVRHHGDLAAKFAGFDYVQHRLFAFSSENVTSYLRNSEITFFHKLLRSPAMRKASPFFRLSLARETGYSYEIARELVSCVNQLRESAPLFADKWYEVQVRSLRKLSAAKLVLPQDWRNLSVRKWETKATASRGHLQRDAQARGDRRMTPADVVNHLAKRTGMQRDQIRELFEHIAALAAREVKTCGEFTLPSLGKLVKSQRKARIGHNPATGETIRIPAKVTLQFRVGSESTSIHRKKHYLPKTAGAGSVTGMTSAAVVQHFAQQTRMNRAEVKQFFGYLANLATSEVKSGGEFVLPGFGKLLRSERKAREGRNPATGETIQIPAKTTLKFRAGKAIRNSILSKK